MARRRFSVSMALVLAARVALAADPAPASAPARTIDVQGEVVTLRVDAVPAQEVLAEVARQTGAELKGEVLERRQVTLQLDAVPLREAVQRVLGEQSFTLTYGDEGKLRTIALRGGPEETPTTTTLAKADVFPDDTPPAWKKVFLAFDHRDAIPVKGRLAELSGKDALHWDYIGNLAFGMDDPRLRTAAVRRGLEAFEDDPALQQAVFDATGAMSDAELAELIRSICKHRSRDFVKRISRLSDRAEIRSRAPGLLREIREQERRSPSTGG